MLKESSLTKGKGSSAASKGTKKTAKDYYIQETKPEAHKTKFVVDFDEDEVPDLE